MGDDDVRILDDDEPFVVQMKLLRRDLRADQLGRRKFELRMKLWVAFIGLFSLLSTLSWWSVRRDDQEDERREERRDCLARQAGREGARTGIIEGGVSNARTLVIVTGSQDDPRAERLIAQTRDDLTKLLDELLPPVECRE